MLVRFGCLIKRTNTKGVQTRKTQRHKGTLAKRGYHVQLNEGRWAERSANPFEKLTAEQWKELGLPDPETTTLSGFAAAMNAFDSPKSAKAKDVNANTLTFAEFAEDNNMLKKLREEKRYDEFWAKVRSMGEQDGRGDIRTLMEINALRAEVRNDTSYYEADVAAMKEALREEVLKTNANHILSSFIEACETLVDVNHYIGVIFQENLVVDVTVTNAIADALIQFNKADDLSGILQKLRSQSCIDVTTVDMTNEHVAAKLK